MKIKKSEKIMKFEMTFAKMFPICASRFGQGVLRVRIGQGALRVWFGQGGGLSCMVWAGGLTCTICLCGACAVWAGAVIRGQS